MPMINYGAGVRSDPMDAYNEMVDAVRRPRLEREALEKQGQLSRLLSQAYGTQDDGQRRGMLQQLIGLDPTMGMSAAKALDPRMSMGDKPSQQKYVEWLLQNTPAEHRDQVIGVHAGYKSRPSSAAIQYKDGEDEFGNPIIRAFDPNNVGGQVMGSGQTYGAPVGTGMRGGAQMQPPSAHPPAMPPAQQGPRGDVFASLPPNLQVTSGLRTPERNRQVGGVANSYHLTNEARDVVPRSPQEAAQVRQWAAQNNMEVIDEGDHLHLEPRGNTSRQGNPTMPPQQPAPQGGGFIGRKKEDESYAVEDARQRAQLANSGAIGQQDAINAGIREAATQDAQIDALDRRGDAEATNAGNREFAVQQAKMRAERDGKRANTALDNTETLTLLDGAEELLKRASGGALEAARDRVAGAFNQTTEGSRATAGLNVISAKLVGKVPRFEGPQGVLDVELYKQAAGDLANVMLPVGQRLAALQTMRQLARNATNQPRGPQSQQPSQQRPSSGGWAIQEVP